jgi:hypothetical protein
MSYCYHLTPDSSQNTVDYAPTHDIYQGMEEAIEWYIESIIGNSK